MGEEGREGGREGWERKGEREEEREDNGGRESSNSHKKPKLPAH